MTMQHSQRTQARRLALQILYQLDVQGEDFFVGGLELFLAGDVHDEVVRETGRVFAQGAWDYREAADRWITALTPAWSVARMTVVDRSILRLAVWELTHTDTPQAVVLDEAITIARDFSTHDSAEFINGVLGAAVKDYAAHTGRAEPAV